MSDPSELKWAAGFLEGEGTFMFYGAGFGICAVQKQLWPLEKLKALYGGAIHPMTDKANRNRGIFKWTLYGRPAVQLAKALDPLMSPRRQDQLRTALGGWLLKPSARRECCAQGHQLIGEGKRRRCAICNNVKAREKRLALGRVIGPRRPRLRVVGNGL